MADRWLGSPTSMDKTLNSTVTTIISSYILLKINDFLRTLMLQESPSRCKR